MTEDFFSTIYQRLFESDHGILTDFPKTLLCPWREENPDVRPDLRKTDLREAHLSRAYLREAYLSQAYLRGADLSGADLSGADLSGTHLRDVNLRGADLSGADMGRADASRADLREADLRRAHLSGVDLTEADLTEASQEVSMRLEYFYSGSKNRLLSRRQRRGEKVEWLYSVVYSTMLVSEVHPPARSCWR
jgi:hypothetical protein